MNPIYRLKEKNIEIAIDQYDMMLAIEIKINDQFLGRYQTLATMKTAQDLVIDICKIIDEHYIDNLQAAKYKLLESYRYFGGCGYEILNSLEAKE